MSTIVATPAAMPNLHQSAAPWLLSLAANDVVPLRAAPTRRWLRVERGQLWVTAAAGTPGPVAPEADIWLAPGDSLALPPGSSWLLQAWPEADFMLLQQAPAASPASKGARAFAAGLTWARRLLRPLLAAPRGACSAHG